MRGLIGRTLQLYLKARFKNIEYFIENAHAVQGNVLRELLEAAAETSYGKKYGFGKIKSYDDFRKNVPIVGYEDIRDDIISMMEGKRDVLWPGQVKMFSKSSGTTSDKSKFLPVSKVNFNECHIKGSWDTLCIINDLYPNLNVFEKKTLIMGGSVEKYPDNPETLYGDISAIMITHMPLLGRPFYALDLKSATLGNWEEKLEVVMKLAAEEKGISVIGGVPTWNIVLFDKILQSTGKKNMLEIWPDLRVYIHGGVNFEPYFEQFKSYIPRDDFIFHEVYNASEGYFATQFDKNARDMLLLLNNGVFFEFMPLDQLGSDQPHTLGLSEVEKDVDYALIISTNSGLWRYSIGDTVRFTSLDPYKIKISGRTKLFINAFGEEVMIANTDEAISKTCQMHNCQLTEYTVAPKFFGSGSKGAHQWLIEFRVPPSDLKQFEQDLDRNLQGLNSDYEAKRSSDLALKNLEIVSMPTDTFRNWLRSKANFSVQNKIPRLWNNRKYVEELLKTLDH